MVVKFVHPRQLLKSANPDGTSVIVLVVDAYPGADIVKVTVPVPASAWTYTGVLLLTEPAKTMRLTLLVPFTTVPSVVRLVESRAFVGSPLVIVTVSLPAGAGTPKLALIPFCKFTPTVVLPKLNVGVLTLDIYNLVLLSVEKPAGVPAILIVVVPTLNGWKRFRCAFVQARSLESTKPQDSGKLIFNRYGDTYFLNQVWSDISSYSVPKSQSEISLSKELAGENRPESGLDVIPVVVADVSGKGVAAGLLMPSIEVAFRMDAARFPRTDDLLGTFNNVVHRITSEDRFISLFYGKLSPPGTLLGIYKCRSQSAARDSRQPRANSARQGRSRAWCVSRSGLRE